VRRARALRRGVRFALHAQRPIDQRRRDPRAPARGIEALWRELAPLALRVEHVGSKAVPGLAAKDVVDLQVSVADLDVAATAFDAPLLPQGFRRSPFERDHVPAGRDDDLTGWAKRFGARREHPDGDANLHVRTAGSPNERVALLFRDWLRPHPSAVSAYAAFKAMLADCVPDLATYADVKDPVVDVINRGRRAVGLRDGSPDPVAAAA
jgi:GrpB-like predicted nucleotidyltransferase (UPF0157 family)